MNSSNKVAVVTGGNRGLGLETCRQLAKKGLRVILTCRDEAKGRAVAERLSKEGFSIGFFPLDVADSASIDRLVKFLERDFGRLDVLVNNAGVMLDTRRDPSRPDDEGWDMNEATAFKAKRETLRSTMETNVYGPLELCQRLIPLMKKNGYGRIVNLSSGMGQLKEMGGGWPAYRISKTAINAVTRIFASETEGSGIKINSVSPGWVKTDMGGEGAQLTPEQGVRTVVWLATLPEDGPSGAFFDEDQDPMEW